MQNLSGANTPQGSSPENLAIATTAQATVAPIQDLAPDLVRHLLECELLRTRSNFTRADENDCTGFEQLPLRAHPDLPLATLRASLESVGWRTSFLPLSSQAFAYAIYACAALIALHPSILGPGPLPTYEELDRAPHETIDWSSFGRRREPACRALREEAFRIAREADVVANYTDATNAACCFLLDYLDNCELPSPTPFQVDRRSRLIRFTGRPFTGKVSRPYAVALLAHARTMAEVSEEPSFAHAMGWSAFLVSWPVHRALML